MRYLCFGLRDMKIIDFPLLFNSFRRVESINVSLNFRNLVVQKLYVGKFECF